MRSSDHDTSSQHHAHYNGREDQGTSACTTNYIEMESYLHQPPPSATRPGTLKRSFPKENARNDKLGTSMGRRIPLHNKISLSTTLSPDNTQGTLKIYTATASDVPFTSGTHHGHHPSPRELYTEVPWVAFHGMQRRERTAMDAYIQYAASIDDDVEAMSASHTMKSGANNGDDEPSISTSLGSFDTKTSNHPQPLWTRALKVAAFAIAGSQFLIGYNVAVMNAPEKYIFPGHSTHSWSLAVAIFALGGAPGVAVAGKLADAQGRHRVLVLNFWLFWIGGLLQTFAKNLTIVTISRFIIGFASGFSTVLAPVYMGELAPPSLRGTLGTLNQLAVVTGILAANILSFPFSTESGWRELFSFTAIVASFQLLLCPFVLESPRWLLLNNPDDPNAARIIQELRGIPDEEVQTELESFITADSASQKKTGSSSTSQLQVIAEMWGNREVRYLLVSIICLHIIQQFSGINAVFFYSTSWFEGIVDQPLLGTLSIGVINVISTYAAVLVMDRVGRRTLLLWSAIGMFLSCIAITLAQCGVLSKMVALIAVNIYVISFELGLGPIPFLIGSEMFEAKYVVVAMSTSCQVNWICNACVGKFFPAMATALGPYSFVPFALVLLLAILFFMFIMPETKERTIEEIMERLMNKNPNTHTLYPRPSLNLEMFGCGGKK